MHPSRSLLLKGYWQRGTAVKRLFFILLAILFIAPFLLPRMIGFSLWNLPQALAVGTGITAKLACSGHYLSGFTDQQNLEDSATYSPAVRAVTLRHTLPNTIETDIAGFAPAKARYYPGLGCTLQYPGMAALEYLEVPELPARLGPWPAGEQHGAVQPQVQALLSEILAQDNAQGLETRALLVIHDGAIAAEVYKDGIGTDTPLLGWSMGKSVSAILLGRMEAMGLLDVAETQLFPAWRGDDRSEISLLNLLQMSSGLDFEEPYVPGSDSTRMLFFAPSAAEVAMESELTTAPGSYFYYSSGTSNLLTRLAWDRLGGDTQALLDFFAAELAIPLGLGNTTLELDASGVFVGSSYVYAPARDWARLGLLMLNDGVAGGQRLLPPGWTQHASSPNSSDNDPRYGYQFWLNGGGSQLRWPNLESGAYAMMGNRAQVVMMLPEHNAVFVRLGWTGVGDYPYDQRIARIQAVLD
jgi:CubicO group peptidase (beta-lactamase class C family)